ncbi:hypothetical protein [uncultured Bradyrhizobium sp.]|jgi:phage FluMu protein Com|uniref:hypothetical protein n=1 Tax=uncultured Bradyrhizobium sp. TaxID=199684 RepID=UPI002610CB94|nr:hypothetical protein [uncultured Bradyrhizobium sp.]
MYDDQDFWPFKCPRCGEEFKKEVGWLKARAKGLHIDIKCPGIVSRLGPILCANTLRYDAVEFRSLLVEAKAGRFDPWRDMIRVNKLS